MTHPTDDEIMKLAGEWFHTGENQKRDDGYYYRSLGTPSNVRGSDLIEFARALLAEQARTEPVAILRELIACEDERTRLVNGVESIEEFRRDSVKLDKRFTEALAQARECVAAPRQTHKAEDAPSDAELLDWLEKKTQACDVSLHQCLPHVTRPEYHVCFYGNLFEGSSIRAAIRAAIAQERST